PVISRAAADEVIAGRAGDRVVAGSADNHFGQDVVLLGPSDRAGVRLAVEGDGEVVGARGVIGGVESRPAQEKIGARSSAIERVIEVASVERVVSLSADQCIVASAAA